MLGHGDEDEATVANIDNSLVEPPCTATATHVVVVADKVRQGRGKLGGLYLFWGWRRVVGLIQGLL